MKRPRRLPSWLAMMPGWRERLRALLPVYFSSWVVALCALLGMGSVSSDPGFLNITLAFTTLGFAVSLLLRLGGIPRSAVSVLLGCVGVAMVVLARVGRGGILLPGTEAIVPSILPAVGLTWFLVIYSFCLITDDLLLFVIPPALAILGLAGTENPNPDMSGYFLVFVIAALFTASYQNYLRYVPAHRLGQSPETLRPVLRWQLVATAALFAVVAALTGLVAVPLNEAGTTGMARFRLPATVLLRSLSVLGYPNMGREIRVGMGPAMLSDRVVLEIASPEPSYWRTRTYDTYTGAGWSDTAGSIPVRVGATADGQAWEAILPDAAEEVAPLRGRRVLLEQKVRAVGTWPSEMLPAAPEPVSFRFPSYPGYLDASGEGTARLGGMARLPVGTGYEVTSQVLRATPAELRSAPPAGKTANPVERAYLDRYLRVPSSAWKVESLAKAVTRDAKNDYDRASAIEAWLSSRYVYNLRVAPVPEGEDAVTHFLLTAKEGYCDLFASAMVVMCRQAGIPARLATGFAEGLPDPDTGVFQVREADSHAWPEVYFSGYGWVRFEPTPAARENLLDDLRRGGWALFINRLKRAVTFPVVILAAVGLLLANLVRLVVYEPWRRRQDLLLRSGSDARGRVLRAYYTACYALRRGVPRRAWQTPREYARSVAERAPDAPWLADLDALTAAFLAARFGRGPIPEEDAERCEAGLARILAGVKPRWRSFMPPRSAMPTRTRQESAEL